MVNHRNLGETLACFAAFLFVAAMLLFQGAMSCLAFEETRAETGSRHGLSIIGRDGRNDTPCSGSGAFLALPPGCERSDLFLILSRIADPGQQRRSSEDMLRRLGENNPQKILSWESPAGKSYLIPALEITGFIGALNGFSRLMYHEKEGPNNTGLYDTNLSTIWDHVAHGPWRADKDNFRVNQIFHPYLGTVYQGFARSAGLNFWESMGYTFLGSFLWETAGETSNPSLNDQVASGIAGNFLGEPLFRMASLVLERSDGPLVWREVGAAFISPPTGFNRIVFGDRFDAVFPSHNPAFFWHADVGATVNTHSEGFDAGKLQHSGAVASFSISYGLPGKPGYRYRRPFDYFKFDLAVATNAAHTVDTVSSRGLLLGWDYEIGDAYRGVWGLYGGFDYIAPNDIRVSSTAVSLGTTAQWRLTNRMALQGSLLAGLGYGGGGDLSGYTKRDYRYGGTAQGIMDLRLILGDRAMIDLAGRGYYLGDVAATSPEGNETIGRLDAGLTLRIHGQHALGARYVSSWRDTNYRGLENQNQRAGVFSLVYTFLSDEGFGVVCW